MILHILEYIKEVIIAGTNLYPEFVMETDNVDFRYMVEFRISYKTQITIFFNLCVFNLHVYVIKLYNNESFYDKINKFNNIEPIPVIDLRSLKVLKLFSFYTFLSGSEISSI